MSRKMIRLMLRTLSLSATSFSEIPPRKIPPILNPGDHRVFKVYRYGGTKSGERHTTENFEIDTSQIGKMVLDAMIKIKCIDPSFTFRRSCREGICGSCAANVNGYNCLTCITNIPDTSVITIYPLPHMYVIRDLVVDLNLFFAGYNSIRPYLIRKETIPMGKNQYAQAISDNKKMSGLYECVLCACCSTACPSYWWSSDKFLGPATLLHAYRWIIDSRDQEQKTRLQQLNHESRLYRCHTILNCSITCPKGLKPGAAIVDLKRLVAGLEKKPPPTDNTMKFADAKK